MSTEDKKVYHIYATPEDMKGNGTSGRYFLLPGSPGRAKKIAARFNDVKVRPSSRGHTVYLGTYQGVDVGVVSTGMGCPSVDIIVTELIILGCRRMFRVGTCGSLQPQVIKYGSLVVATGVVRDEGTTRHYAPPEWPALPAPEAVEALTLGATRCGFANVTFRGVMHTKDSLYAREFHKGVYGDRHEEYMQTLKAVGVMGSEMEIAQTLTLAHVHNQSHPAPISDPNRNRATKIIVGALCVVVGDDQPFGAKRAFNPEHRLIEIGLASLVALLEIENRPPLQSRL